MPTTLPPRRPPPHPDTRAAIDDAQHALDTYRAFNFRRLYWTLGILSAICIVSGIALLVWAKYFATPAH